MLFLEDGKYSKKFLNLKDIRVVSSMQLIVIRDPGGGGFRTVQTARYGYTHNRNTIRLRYRRTIFAFDSTVVFEYNSYTI